MAGLSQAGKRGFVATVHATERVNLRLSYEHVRHLQRKRGGVTAGIRALIERDLQPSIGAPASSEEWGDTV